MFLLKIRHPKYYFILRGNHECENIKSKTFFSSRVYGFLDECRTRYGGEVLWRKFQPAFDLLPVAALVSNKIFCMHGGLSPYLNTFQQIRNMRLPLPSPDGPGLLADL
uniref:Serine/threonine specific protein phosphatases domain-containing protein n=1 Tax=Romanomermis culicivorax TaxID=13658 RepID=A0A915IT26_ROMCU